MKTHTPLLCLLLVLTSRIAFGQASVGPLVLDSAFGTNGALVTDIAGGRPPVSGDKDSVTCYAGYKGSDIVIGGLAYDNVTASINIGLVRTDSNGSPRMGFGTKGVARLEWAKKDYPNVIQILPSGGLLIAGGSSATLGNGTLSPTLFRITADGKPDLSWGVGGQVTRLLGETEGEFTGLDTFVTVLGSHRVLATGHYSLVTGGNGFFVVVLDSNGVLVDSYGAGGYGGVPIDISYGRGFMLRDHSVIFIGATGNAPKTEIVLCKLKPSGQPDSSFGVNSLLHTGITTSSKYYFASNLSNDNIIVAISRQQTDVPPYTLLKFKSDGSLVTTFGTNGYLTAPSTAGLIPHGMTVSNDHSILLAGEVDGRSAVARFLDTGKVDPSFGVGGLAMADPSSLSASNYLVGFIAGGGRVTKPRKFFGVGTIRPTESQSDFFIAKYFSAAEVLDVSPNRGISFELYPNPAQRTLQVTSGEEFNRVDMHDQLGRTVMISAMPPTGNTTINVDKLPAGVYTVAVQLQHGTVTSRVIIEH